VRQKESNKNEQKRMEKEVNMNTTYVVKITNIKPFRRV
jgi:hypothetical protein